ncbi:MAG: BrnT family toxin [Sulfuricella sp.]
MEITFNPAKDTANISKHGVSLVLAADLEWDWLLFERDARHDYGEVRMIGYAPLGKRVYCVVFTDRGETRHIISLRKANTREVKHYERHIQTKT